MVFITGETGLGKSRLAYQLARRLHKDESSCPDFCVSLDIDSGYTKAYRIMKRLGKCSLFLGGLLSAFTRLQSLVQFIEYLDQEDEG